MEIQMSEQLKEAIENFDGKEKSNEALKESIRETVRNAVDNSVNGSVNGLVNEQMLAEGLLDRIKKIFSKDSKGLQVSYMRKGDKVAIFSINEDTNEFGFILVDNQQGKKLEEKTLNGKSDIKQKSEELKEKGFESITDKRTAKDVSKNFLKFFGGAGVGAGIHVLAATAYLVSIVGFQGVFGPGTFQGLLLSGDIAKAIVGTAIGGAVFWEIEGQISTSQQKQKNTKDIEKARSIRQNN